MYPILVLTEEPVRTFAKDLDTNVAAISITLVSGANNGQVRKFKVLIVDKYKR